MYNLFIDESGDHNLIQIDDQYPVFVLTGIVIKEDYHNSIVTEEMKKFKKEHFDNENIILHTADLTRNKNGFEKLKDMSFRIGFYEKLNALIAGIDFKIIAAVIKKKEYKLRYGTRAIDPYLFCLEVLIERFIYELRETNEKGILIAEARNSLLDNQLDIAYLNIKVSGTKFIRSKEIKENIDGLFIKKKEVNLAGLQIADLAATPIGRYVIGKKVKKDFEIVESKFRKNADGRYKGYGLVIFP
jgi:hypothetical protein